VLERSHEEVVCARRRSGSLDGLHALVGEPFGLIHLLSSAIVKDVAPADVLSRFEPFLEVRILLETFRVKHQTCDVSAYGGMVGDGFKLTAALRMIQ
jgi:hypothetical protein